MRLLANENFPLPSVAALRQEGHDVLSMSEHSPGMSDERVPALAHQEQRVLLTFDRDYGLLVYARRLAGPPNIGFLRFRPQSPVEPANWVKPVLGSGEDALRGFPIVLERDGCRRRPLP